MMPKINPRMMQQAMRQMGMKQEDLDAVEVVIRLRDRDLVISPAGVAKVTMMGQESFQVSGPVKERSRSAVPDIQEDDVKTVMEQAGVDEATAKKALKEAKGDIAEAILTLKGE
jgi:nascent polypeptide-associated complex subunit alpha